MLLADPAHGDFSTSAIGQGQAEDTFGLKQAKGMLSGQSNCLFSKTSCRRWGFPVRPR
jgi:hypothetical protein